MERYAIFEGNMERVSKKMTRIRNKCRKYGCDFHFAEVGEEFRTVKNEDGEEYTARFVLVEAEGRAVVNGWRFVAALEHTDKGNIIDKAADIEVPERYYTGAPVCEHCGNRRVKRTFIVRSDETGEFRQVGNSCLCDYTHGMSAEGVAQYASAFEELIKGEKVDAHGHGNACYDVKTLLLYAAETVRHFGYVKNDPESYSTCDRAMDFFGCDHNWKYLSRSKEAVRKAYEECGFDHESPEAKDMVEKALAWLDEQNGDGNYMHNLKVACSLEHDSGKNFGIMASLFPAWNRDLERREKARREQEALKDSEWAGEVGERVSFNIAAMMLITSWETIYGTTYVYRFTGEDGNVYTWKTGKDIPETAKKVTGTVKEHREYRGVKQTELTRCRVA